MWQAHIIRINFSGDISPASAVGVGLPFVCTFGAHLSLDFEPFGRPLPLFPFCVLALVFTVIAFVFLGRPLGRLVGAFSRGDSMLGVAAGTSAGGEHLVARGPLPLPLVLGRPLARAMGGRPLRLCAGRRVAAISSFL